MIIIFWANMSIMLAALAWDVYHWLAWWSYAKKAKIAGVPLWQRLQDPEWRRKLRAAAQDTAASLLVAQICAMLMPYMVGYSVGMLIGLAISIQNRILDRQAQLTQN